MKKLEEFIKQAMQKKSEIIMPNSEYLKKIEKLSFKDSYIWMLFLGLFEKYGSWDKFDYEEMQKSVDSHGKDELFFYFGIRYINFKTYDKAIEIWKRYLKKYPQDYDAYYYLGITYQSLRAYKKAIDSYRMTISLEPKHYKAHLKMADTYREAGNAIQSIAYYKQAIELNQIDEQKSENYYWLVRIGNLYSNNEEAEIYYRKAIKFNPQKYSAYFNLANNYRDQKRYDEAIELYKQSVEFDPHGYYNLANAYKSLTKYKKAIWAYQKAIEFDPNHDKAYVNMGNTYGTLEKQRKALTSHEKALEINPKRVQAYIGIFEIYGEKKEYLPQKIEDMFVENFKDDKNIYLLYVVFGYLWAIYDGKEVDLSIFEKEYKDAGMKCCKFKAKKILKNTRKKDKKRVAELLEVLKKHTKMIGN
jgi:tetratricopeptide (TPR) repeat protein